MNEVGALSNEEQTFSKLIQLCAVALPERMTLESLQDFIYLSDLDTYELHLISMVDPSELAPSFRDYKGKKCYEVLQGRTSPCPFCTNRFLEKDLDYIWRHHNDVLGRDYILKDRLVDWKGKATRMEVVIDVTEPSRINTVLQRSLESQNIFAGCIRHLIGTMSPRDGCVDVLQKVGEFFGAESGFIQRFGDRGFLSQWSAAETDTYHGGIGMPSAAATANWNTLLEPGSQVIVKDTEALRELDIDCWKMMQASGTHSLCATPIYVRMKVAGFIYLRNFTAHWTEMPLLTMLANFLAMLLEKESLEQEAMRLQFYDTLTNSLNFEGYKREVIQILEANPRRKHALWYCDIKNFKYINDVFGYEVGDRFLQHWAEYLRSAEREGEVFGRSSGDHFALFCWYEDRAELQARFDDMAAALTAFAPTATQKYRIDLFAGVYLIETLADVLTLDEMLNRANMAQKRVKDRQGSRLAFYDEAVRKKIIRDMQLEAAMQDALKNEEFVLYLQPQVPLGVEGEVLRAEALVRWQQPDGTLLLPGEFIELFEKDGMIVDLDRYVFERACCYQQAWQRSDKGKLCIAVNVSRISMLQPNFVAEYCRMKDAYHVPDGMIELEFTETIVVENYEQFRDAVQRLRAHGFLCAMDDFGTCQSSLNMLRNLPLDVLKLDRLFFLADGDEDRGRAVVGCVLQLAQALQMNTVAEGIETMPLVEELRAMGCDFVQGFVFAKPMPAEKLFSMTNEELAYFTGRVVAKD